MINQCLKEITVVDPVTGAKNMPISESLLPSIFQAKVTHPEYELWKDLSERDNKNWEAVQKSFLKRSQAQKSKHENRFKTNCVQGG